MAVLGKGESGPPGKSRRRTPRSHPNGRAGPRGRSSSAPTTVAGSPAPHLPPISGCAHRAPRCSGMEPLQTSPAACRPSCLSVHPAPRQAPAAPEQRVVGAEDGAWRGGAARPGRERVRARASERRAPGPPPPLPAGPYGGPGALLHAVHTCVAAGTPPGSPARAASLAGFMEDATGSWTAGAP